MNTTNKSNSRVWIAAALAASAALLLSAPTVHASTINSSSSINLTKGLVGYWTFDGKDTNWTSAIVTTTL